MVGGKNPPNRFGIDRNLSLSQTPHTKGMDDREERTFLNIQV